jgi:hypothetical protein
LTAATADLTLVLFWTSLGVSAVIVCLFLWLMRDRRETEDGGRKTTETGRPETPP